MVCFRSRNGQWRLSAARIRHPACPGMRELAGVKKSMREQWHKTREAVRQKIYDDLSSGRHAVQLADRSKAGHAKKYAHWARFRSLPPNVLATAWHASLTCQSWRRFLSAS